MSLESRKVMVRYLKMIQIAINLSFLGKYHDYFMAKYSSAKCNLNN